MLLDRAHQRLLQALSWHLHCSRKDRVHCLGPPELVPSLIVRGERSVHSLPSLVFREGRLLQQRLHARTQRVLRPPRPFLHILAQPIAHALQCRLNLACLAIPCHAIPNLLLPRPLLIREQLLEVLGSTFASRLREHVRDLLQLLLHLLRQLLLHFFGTPLFLQIGGSFLEGVHHAPHLPGPGQTLEQRHDSIPVAKLEGLVKLCLRLALQLLVPP
mmetsp:Transcript_11996/g.23920  ORF Transcript_11996/g.23920 Transcript_11996/m.23920 type:complete len:216 (+) Transcript_11996:587-1234(+)